MNQSYLRLGTLVLSALLVAGCAEKKDTGDKVGDAANKAIDKTEEAARKAKDKVAGDGK